ncbi:hypothetical protein AVEN_50476-1 [Araneus ventricosus]|uniref:Transposase IS30-like HTH domain-containing protein n=1 Tax=Araneus ventricosus TaxID=182803 RepID=A0A4Y2APM4_ARAVE|nr:hypothetical protein AVEN_50476-1 [Araneus ventricosus]
MSGGVSRLPGILFPFRLTFLYAACFILSPYIPRRQAKELSMRSCLLSVCLVLLLDSRKLHALAVRPDGSLNEWCTVAQVCQSAGGCRTYASSDSSAESEIAKAKSMSRRNHLHNEMRWRAVGMLQAGAKQSAVARQLNVHRSVIHRLWNHYHRDQNASRIRGSGNRRITTRADDRYLL